MSLQITKESGSVYNPVFLKILEDIPGGVTIKTNRFPTATKEIKKGTLLNADASSAGLYNVIKTVRATAASTTSVTVIAIEPADHLFIAGEIIFLTAAGPTATTITRVSATAIAFSATGVVVASGAVLYEATTVNTTGVLLGANAVLRDNVEVRKAGVTTLLDNLFAGAVVRGTVDESMLPYFVPTIHKTNLTDRIRFA